jgi:two-component system, sensor histidine kinase LadS
LKFILKICYIFIAVYGHAQIDGRSDLANGLSLDEVASVFKDESNLLGVDNLLKDNYVFAKDHKHFNFGLSWSTYWLKFNLENKTAEAKQYMLVFESVTNDTITLYQCRGNKGISSQNSGEGIQMKDKAIKNLKPVFSIYLPPHAAYTFFIAGKASGQPVNLSGKILSQNQYEKWNYKKLFFNGAAYGIILIILLLNLSFFITTNEKLYINFTLQVFCSWLCMAYFDGYITKYLITDNLYWSNQCIAIAVSFTFVFSNLSVREYFNLNTLAPIEDKATKLLTFIILGLCSISFFHPIGFFLYICTMIIVTSLVALLLYKSILLVKKRGFATYFYGLMATINLIIFGSMFQMYIAGALPDNFITQNAMHIAVVGQSLFMALAVNDKFKHIKEENNKYQERLVMALNEYAQNLTTNIEGERQRLANDLHDSLGQNLLSIRNKILLIKKRKQAMPEVDKELDFLSHAISGTLEEVRTISYNLRPPILNTLGLTAAINSLVESIKSSCDFEVYLNFDKSIDGMLKKDLEINVYRILQECFNNVTKHSNASKVFLSIKVLDKIIFDFEDNGCGFDTEKVSKGQGLIGIKERVALLHGEYTIQSHSSTGTQIRFSFPIFQP